MPGFNVGPFSGGQFGAQGPSNVTEYRRKYRWYFKTIGRGTGTFSTQELLRLHKATRPKFNMKKTKAHFVQEETYVATKHSWEPLKLTWYDTEQNPNVSQGIYHWIETVIDLRNMNVATPQNYKRTASFSMIDGFGNTGEDWTLYGTWPEDVDWGPLEYSSEELCTIDVIMSFDRAVRLREDGSCVNPTSGNNANVGSCPV